MSKINVQFCEKKPFKAFFTKKITKLIFLARWNLFPFFVVVFVKNKGGVAINGNRGLKRDRRVIGEYLYYTWVYHEHGTPKTIFSKWAKWANKQNEQMSKHFYSFKKMSKHFYYKMSKMNKWLNEQNAHMNKFGVKWAPEVLIYYKNIPGCTMLMVYPDVPWVNSGSSPELRKNTPKNKNKFLLARKFKFVVSFCKKCFIRFFAKLNLQKVFFWQFFH